MFKKFINPVICLIVLGLSGLSQAFSPNDPSSEVQIISSFPEPSDDGDFLFLYGRQQENLYSILDGADGQRYLFVMREGRLAYYKKPSGSEWADEKYVVVASGVSPKYPSSPSRVYMSVQDKNQASIVVRGRNIFDETRVLTLDLSTMTLIKNDILVESSLDLVKEYYAQDAVPSSGPQTPNAVSVFRVSKMKNSKLIYYYATLQRQEDGRIVEKGFYRFYIAGVWSKVYEVGKFSIPNDLAETYKKKGTLLTYGEDVSADRFAVMILERKKTSPKNLSKYALLIYRETKEGKISLEIVERDDTKFVPTLTKGFIQMNQAFYNDKTAELSLTVSAPAFVQDQVFSVFDMKEKKLVKTYTVAPSEGRMTIFASNLVTKSGENLGLQISVAQQGEADFSFIQWTGEKGLKFFDISKGPVPRFDAIASPLIWSEDKNSIYSFDDRGSICETKIDAGLIRCVTPNLEEATGIDGIESDEDGSLSVVKDGVVELVSSALGGSGADGRKRVIYSVIVDFNKGSSE